MCGDILLIELHHPGLTSRLRTVCVKHGRRNVSSQCMVPLRMDRHIYREYTKPRQKALPIHSVLGMYIRKVKIHRCRIDREHPTNFLEPTYLQKYSQTDSIDSPTLLISALRLYHLNGVKQLHYV